MVARGQILQGIASSAVYIPTRGQILSGIASSEFAGIPVRGQILQGNASVEALPAAVLGHILSGIASSKPVPYTLTHPSQTVPSYSRVTAAAVFNEQDTTVGAIDFDWICDDPQVTFVASDNLQTATFTIPAQYVSKEIRIGVRVLLLESATDYAFCTLTVQHHVKWCGFPGATKIWPVGDMIDYDLVGAPAIPTDPGGGPIDPPVDPPPVDPPPSTGTPTDGAWYEALPPGYGSEKNMPHFFPPFVISIQNDPRPNYWDKNWITPAIEGQTDHRVYGGYTRDEAWDIYEGARPQPTATWRFNDAVQNVDQAALYGIDGFYMEGLGDKASLNYTRNIAIRDAANFRFPAGNFKVTPMPDMNNSTVKAFTATQMADYLAPFAVVETTPGLASYTRQPCAWYLPDGRFVFSCFLSDVQVSPTDPTLVWPASRWQAVLDMMVSRWKTPCAFIIGVNNLNLLPSWSSISYGENFWGGGATPGVPNNQSNHVAISASRGKKYIMSVWPSDIRPYVALYDDAYNTGTARAYCEKMVRDHPAGTQLATWSDYSEGGIWQRTIGRGRVLQKIFGYYNVKYKTGSFPPILRNCVILSHRNQLFPTGTTYRADASGVYTKKMSQWNRGANTGPVRNNIEVLTFLTTAAQITLTCGAMPPVVYNAPAGMFVHDTTPAVVGTPRVVVRIAGVDVINHLSHVAIGNNRLNQNPYYYYSDSIDGTAGMYDVTEAQGV